MYFSNSFQFRNQFYPARIYINRYVRYIPAVLVLIMFFSSSLPRYIVSGPFLGNITYEVGKCKKWWWSSLLFVQNYVNLKENCLNQTWYLSADFQLFLITPIVVFMLKKFGRKFMVGMAVLIVAFQFLTFDDLQQ